MKCPVCKSEMHIERKDISTNFESGQKYERTLYHCDKSDAWITMETPLNKEKLA